MSHNTPSRAFLVRELDKTSFAANDLALFLDTHPDCPEALASFRSASGKRRELLNQYAAAYGPLTTDCICTLAQTDHWSWQDGPAPWEGGEL